MATARRVPRSFEFHWGKGTIQEEASVVTPHHEPTIQLLHYETGEKAIRFCAYHGTRFSRMPLLVDEDTVARLGKEVRKNPSLHKLLKKLVS